MKRKNKSRNRIGYQQLEERKLLAAIANGQEIESSIDIGESETFELQVVNPGTVRLAISDMLGQPENADLSIFGPNGNEVSLSRAPASFGNAASSSTQASFVASSSGTYSLTVNEFGNDEALDFRIRALALADSFSMVVGRDQQVSNGEESTQFIPRGSFGVFPLGPLGVGSLYVSAGANPLPEHTSLANPRIELYRSDGTFVARNSGSNSLFTETQQDSYTAVVSPTHLLFFDNPELTVRSVAIPSQPAMIEGRDLELENGVEVVTSIPAGKTAIFSFDVNSPSQLLFSAAPVGPSAAGTSTRIFDPLGNPLNIFNSNPYAELTGTYRVMVTSSSANALTGSDQFRVRAFAIDGNETFLPERDLVLENGGSGVATTDRGTYSLVPITVTTPGRVIVSTDVIGDNDRVSVRIYDPTGDQVRSQEIGDATFDDFFADSPGTYLVMIEASEDTDVSVRYLVLADSSVTLPDRDQNLENGVEFSSSIPPGSFNYFQLQVNQPGPVVFPLTNGGLIRVYDEAGNLVGGNSVNQDRRFVAEEAQTFTAIIYNGNVDSSVDLVVRGIVPAESPQLIEGSDHLLESGQEVVSSIGPSNSSIYQFDANAGDFVRLNVSTVGTATGRPSLQVFDPDGVDLGFNSSVSRPYDFTAPSSGTYIAVVRGHSSAQPSNLRVRLLLLPESPTLVEGRDTAFLGQGSETVASSVPAGGFNLFTIPVTEPGQLFVQVLNQQELNSSSSVRPVVELFDPAGNMIASGTDLFQGFNHATVEVAGLYTASVRTSVASEVNFIISVSMLRDSETLTNGQELVFPLAPGGIRAFPIDVDAEGTVTAWASRIDSQGFDLKLQTFNPDGSQQFPFSNSGFDLFTATQSGTHYAIASLSRTALDSADFRFRAIAIPGEPVLIEGRDLALEPGIEATAQVPARSFSVHSFDITEPGPIVFSARSFSSGTEASASFEIYDPDGVRISSFSDPLVFATKSGTYKAIVYAGNFDEPITHIVSFVAPNDSPALFPGRDANLETGNEFLSSLPAGQSAIFPLSIDQPGQVSVYVGQVDNTGGRPDISIYDELGILVAQDFRGFSSADVIFQAQADKSYFAVVDGNESFDFRIRLVSLTGANELIPDRDFVVSEGSRVGGAVPSGGVTLANLNVEQPGEMTFFYVGQDLTIYNPSGQSIFFDVDDGILSLDVQQAGQYLLVARDEFATDGFSFGLRPFNVQIDNDQNLIEGLDHTLQNGQELTATLPAGGISVIPLDIDFAERVGVDGGLINIAGNPETASIIPFVQIFDADGNELASNEGRFSFSGFENEVRLHSRFPEPLFAVISSNSSSEAIDFTIRAANLTQPVALIPGRDVALQNGVPFLGQSGRGIFSFFPVKVDTPGLLQIEVNVTLADAGLNTSFVQIVDPNGRTVASQVVTDTINAELNVDQLGSYAVVLGHTARQELDFEITVSGISRAKPAVTSFQRDSRLGTRAEVLAQPDSVEQLMFRFNQDVAVQVEDLILRNDSTGELVDVSGASFSYDPATLSATWDLTTLETSLPAAFYSASFATGAITSVTSGDAMADDYSSRFHVALSGDANLDGVVNVLNDAFALVGNLGKETGAFWSDGDFSGNRSVGVLDDGFPIVSNLNMSIIPTEVMASRRDDVATEEIETLERPDQIQTLSVDFSVKVDAELDDLILRNLTTDTPVNLDGATYAFDSVNQRATWDLSTLSTPLPAGYYSYRITSASITNSETGQGLLQDYSDDFYVALSGDSNLDGRVNVLGDGFALVSNLGTTGDADWNSGDFNDDENVNVLGDGFILVGNLGSSVEVDDAFAQFDS